MIKIDSQSDIGKAISEDFKNGAIVSLDQGTLYKATTNQTYGITNQDRLVRHDGNVQAYSAYNADYQCFVPTNALRDGEAFDSSRKLGLYDIVAKKTWTQLAGDVAMGAAQGVAAGAVIGAVGGAAVAGIDHFKHRGWLPGGDVMPTIPSQRNGTSNVVLHHRNLRVASAAMHANGPFHPGDLNPPPPWMEPVVPPPANNPGQAAEEAAAEAAWAGIGGLVGGCLGGPAGAAVGAVLGAGIGAAWNAIF